MILYLCRLVPPRPATFAIDMSPEEAEIMQKHVRYWQVHAASGRVLVFGPVADPEGAFGIAVIVAEEGEELTHLCKDDPAIKSNCGFQYKLHLIPRHVLGAGLTADRPAPQ